MDWMEDSIFRYLAGVPQGRYRRRAEQELRGHLADLCRELEGAGYGPEEARAAALERMGDPAELSARYRAQWRRRELRSPWSWRIRGALALGFLSMIVTGFLYMVNTRNFGKSVVGLYGLVGIPVSLVLLGVLLGRWDGKWTFLRWGGLYLALMQLPPVTCWALFYGTYEIDWVLLPGWIFVPGWAGLLFHLGTAVWSLTCFALAGWLENAALWDGDGLQPAPQPQVAAFPAKSGGPPGPFLL